MSSESFDLITQELVKHQQNMELLQAENQELRQQLADLRAGRGIYIEINGLHFGLNASFISQTSMQTSSAKASSSIQQHVSSPSIADKLATVTSEVSSIESVQEPLAIKNNKKEEKASFLEEAMINEFTSALGSSLTLPQQDSAIPQEKSEEEQKAVLRRDLMGSYLLD